MTAQLVKSHFMQRAGNEAVRELAGFNKVNVLVVEDDAGCRQCYESIFKHPVLAGFTLHVAESVNEAMALIVMNCFDLCLLDYQLNRRTGAELVKTWREYGYELPFVCVSGVEDPEVDAEMQRLGAIGFANKMDTMTPAAMERTIRYALANYWRQRAA